MEGTETAEEKSLLNKSYRGGSDSAASFGGLLGGDLMSGYCLGPLC